MKKIIFIFLIATAMECQAQSSLVQLSGTKWGLLGDTVINTGTANDSTIMQRAEYSASVLVTITKVSGTVSATCLLQCSVDGIHWTSSGQDTATLAPSTGTSAFTWQLPGRQLKSNSNGNPNESTPPALPYLYYRVNATGTGTMRAILKSWMVIR